jgi:hypothetical protein
VAERNARNKQANVIVVAVLNNKDVLGKIEFNEPADCSQRLSNINIASRELLTPKRGNQLRTVISFEFFLPPLLLRKCGG